MRRGKGPLAARCGPRLRTSQLRRRAYLSLLPPITGHRAEPSESSWLGRGGRFGMTSIR